MCTLPFLKEASRVSDLSWKRSEVISSNSVVIWHTCSKVLPLNTTILSSRQPAARRSDSSLLAKKETVSVN